MRSTQTAYRRHRIRLRLTAGFFQIEIAISAAEIAIGTTSNDAVVSKIPPAAREHFDFDSDWKMSLALGRISIGFACGCPF
jgi:hypothetical protein